MASTIADNLAAVRDSIAEAAQAAGRDPQEVTLIAVSKTKPAAAVAQALAAGQRVFGENRVQEALGKIEAVPPGAEWHLVGHLQSNKARQVPGKFSTVHSLDSPRLALALQKQAAQAGVSLGVLIQLNLKGEASKGGVRDMAGLGALLQTVLDCPALSPRGLMTLPDPGYSEAETRRHFAEVRGLRDSLRAEFGLGPAFRELSMGMSHDFAWAIAEGATMVRIGTAIFGARP
ncbi:MAG: YggS family pyridoxal phosphate-dependent enzyme [SAR324 cluster bacterium]|nr:YggS family pyridoxal phosphate-dependent enzyme [SAR324 cluster bacterium]